MNSKRNILQFIILAFIVCLTSCGAFGEGMLAGLSGMGGYGAYPAYYGGGGNVNSLLDPRLAMAQVAQQQAYMNQVNSALISTTVNQMNAQEESEYQEFIKYNKKADGSNYTKNEWRAFKGQALQEMKNSAGSSVGNNRSSSSSSSKSSSTNRSESSKKRCTKLSATDIAHCNGTGLCGKCNGKKKYFDTSFGNSRWVDPCIICHGTGKCESCGGTGWK